MSCIHSIFEKRTWKPSSISTPKGSRPSSVVDAASRSKRVVRARRRRTWPPRWVGRRARRGTQRSGDCGSAQNAACTWTGTGTEASDAGVAGQTSPSTLRQGFQGANHRTIEPIGTKRKTSHYSSQGWGEGSQDPYTCTNCRVGCLPPNYAHCEMGDVGCAKIVGVRCSAPKKNASCPPPGRPKAMASPTGNRYGSSSDRATEDSCAQEQEER